MKEETVFFPVGDIPLEGRLARNDGDRAVVICHPHPQMGGSMDNNVVETLVVAYGGAGFTTLRFNFRGAGRSGGAYDEGRGERDDVLAAVTFLAGEGFGNTELAGYSFGAWVISRVLAVPGIVFPAILVSPPAGFMEFDFSGWPGNVRLVTAGDRDPYLDQALVREEAQRAGADFELIPGADHFYGGRERLLLEVVRKRLSVC
ncbi:MAG: alpha/beta hydrolase [Deltaproteobacteria bacterium HGW-Deltaproteobacteria-19]|nr:MAG: alpha/beta hydrolase [Deltaproteobacteria bacterium HGW-Deltaproteobacteria-19]